VYLIGTKKPVVASEEEIDRNPRSRSAKLRVAERVA
jgi:16S rRNA (cytosine1402-N4)-methyltransferase